MAVKRPFRLPSRFNRRVTRRTRRLVTRTYRSPLRRRMSDRWHRWSRIAVRMATTSKQSLLQWCAVAILSIAVLIVGLLLFSPIGRIDEIRVIRSDPRLDIEQVEMELSSLFGRHLIVLSTSDVRELLQGKIFDLASVDITKRYPSQLVVTITLDPLIARLQIGMPDESGQFTGSGSTDFLTNRGMLVSSPSERGGGGALPLIRIVDWTVRPKSGDRIFPADSFAKLIRMEEALDVQFKQQVKTRTVYLRAQEFHLQTAGPTLWFDFRGTLEEQLSRYRTYLQAAGPDGAKEYIDLRLAGRVVYK